MLLQTLCSLLIASIPILGWHGVNPEKFQEIFPLMKEAGFDGYLAKVRDKTLAFSMLDATQVAGIKAMPGFPELNTNPEEMVPLIKDHPALMAYYLKDEPETWDLDSLGALVRRVQAIDANIPCYINLYPNWAWVEEKYVEHINMFADKCPVPFISFDQYPVTQEDDGSITIRPTWYRNLEEIRTLCIERGKPMWAFALLQSHILGNPPEAFYPVPTLGHLRLQVFSDLAYGAQVIQYYTFLGAVTWNGEKTSEFDIVKQVNYEIKGLSQVFQGCEVLDVWHLNEIPKGTKALKGRPDSSVKSISVSGMGAVVSLFRNRGRRYLAVVNKDCVNPEELHIRLGRKVMEVTKTGGRIAVKGCSRTLEPGDMVVYELGLDRRTKAVISVVPYPTKVSIRPGYIHIAGSDVQVAPGLECIQTAELTQKLAISSSETSTSSIIFKKSSSLDPEAYTLDIRQGKVTVKASAPAGARYAVATILQMLPSDIYADAVLDESDFVLPCVSVKDSPRYAYRGFELDCSRHFFTVDEVKKCLDMMAIYKLNRFHWHLTDDHGWRMEIKQLPRLTEVGAWRDNTLIGWITELDGIPHGGYYTQDELREMVAYAKDRGIEIMPEIDLPAHIVSALAAYPELGCTGGPYEMMKVWDIAKDILCVGKESTFDFLDKVFTEVCDIFPYEYIHIGGDECPKDRWKNCPACQAKIAELGLVDTETASAEQYLQNYVTARVQKMLEEKGKRVIGWDEILEGDLAPGATIMSWRGTEGGIKAAKAGFDVIMTPVDYCYLDYVQSKNRAKEPVGPSHVLTLEKCYSFNPVAGLNKQEAKHVLGMQGNLWTEFVYLPEHMEYMMLPRLLAISEDAWSQPKAKDFSRFQREIVYHQEEIFRAIDINYRPE